MLRRTCYVEHYDESKSLILNLAAERAVLVPLQDSIIEIEIDTDLARLFPVYPVRRCKNLRKNQTA